MIISLSNRLINYFDTFSIQLLFVNFLKRPIADFHGQKKKNVNIVIYYLPSKSNFLIKDYNLVQEKLQNHTVTLQYFSKKFDQKLIFLNLLRPLFDILTLKYRF